MQKKPHSAALHGKYISFRNCAQNLKTQLKTNYFSTQLEENQKNPKKLWQILKSVGTCKNKISSNNISLKIKDEICFDKLKVAERFNSYFSTIAASLVNKLPTCTGRFGLDHIKQFYNQLNISKSSFSFQHITEDFVHKTLLSL